jgi:hypothetical protein
MNLSIRWFVAILAFCSTLGATLGSLTVLAYRPVKHTDLVLVTAEELEKTKLILGFAERNCKKLGFRVEGSGAYVSVTCGNK